MEKLFYMEKRLKPKEIEEAELQIFEDHISIILVFDDGEECPFEFILEDHRLVDVDDNTLIFQKKECLY